MFKDRFDAANKLLDCLQDYKNNPNVVIIAIPRGALQIGAVLAQELKAPLDVIFSKKIGASENPELAIGALSLHAEIIDPLYKNDRALQEYIAQERDRIRDLLRKRYEQYRGKRQPIDLHNKIVIITDDGIATGQTMMLAIEEIKKKDPQKIIVAVPIAAADPIEKIKKKVDEVICLLRPHSFYGISQFYQQFDQVEDDEAIDLLKKANQ